MRDWDLRRVRPEIVTGLLRLPSVCGTGRVSARLEPGRGWAVERVIAAARMISGARFPRIQRRYIGCV